ncbi:5'-nucleotidase C-terminal domain-containing protein [Rothia terrae]|uniref:5'-nucleotidase C-terminal domain-containing protein n=1 Tax=Rothia terrae TaxID=396015 RepID=UPI003804783F
MTNEIYPGDTRGIPDYSYDILSGVNYHINISKPVGQRIENLTLADGTELADDARVVLAVNNYRWSGGSGYPHVTNAPIVYEEQKAVRDLMIDWAIEHKTIDPADFFEQSWTVGTSAAVQEPVPSEPAPSEPMPAPSEVDPSQPAPAPSEVAPGEDSSVVTPVPASAESEDPSVSVGDADSAAGQPQPVTVNQDDSATVAREDASSSAISRGALAHTGAHVAGVLIASALLLLTGGAALMVSRRKKA